MSNLEELKGLAETARSQTDRMVTAIQNLIEEQNGKESNREEIIYPSAEMLEGG